jgi:hypothetical protein
MEIIPGGYTSKLQVMDVGLNRPFKFYYQEAAFAFFDNGHCLICQVKNPSQVGRMLLIGFRMDGLM